MAPYDSIVDLTPSVAAARVRLRRLYGLGYELVPPPGRARFHPIETDVVKAFYGAHRPPAQYGNIHVLRPLYAPVAYFVDATCTCDWCIACRDRGIVPLANQPT